VRVFVLTRSSYAPELPLEDNRHRLELLRGIAVPAMRAQTNRDVTWLALINPSDPLLEQRRAAFESSGLPIILAPSGDMAVTGVADAPWGPWAEHIEHDEATLTFRLDDDDAIAPTALALLRAYADQWAARQSRRRVVLILPVGYRIVGHMAERAWLRRPMSQALYAPKGDPETICGVSHLKTHRLGIVREVTQAPMWLWPRHRWTRSNYCGSLAGKGRPQRPRPIDDALRAAFPIDWSLIEGLDMSA
jgi:Putative rhamnosyl transferase